MKMKSLNMKSLGGAVLLGLTVLAANPSFAADANPCSATSVKSMAMDANHDGKVSKKEFLAAMTAIFEQHAGAKGYCTVEEAKSVIDDIQHREFPW
ncbi:MAG TPA: hypothetical protein VMV87_13365 [Burkholderiales bacterium]|nr:hypothetical protein [Burkholderiales bacterium]